MARGLGQVTKNKTTAAAAPAAGLVPIVPTSVTVNAGSATTSANGLVTFTGASNVSLDGVFSARYRNYHIVWQVDGAENQGNLLCRVRAGGVSQTSGVYSFAAYRTTSDSTSQQDQCGNYTPYFLIGDMNSSSDGAGTIDISNPFLTKRTQMTSLFNSSRTDFRNYIVMAGAHVRDTTSYDGFFMQAGSSAAATGSVSVYGYTI